MPRGFASVCFVFLVANPAEAVIYGLQAGGSPSLYNKEGGLLAWWEGGPAFLLASSGAVRANLRGLYTYPPGKCVMRDLHALGWHNVPCNVSAWGLCSSDVGHVFPARDPRMPESPESVLVDGWSDLSCANSRDKLLVGLGVYDVSVCDVLDEGLDVVFSNGQVFHRHNSLDSWEYWIFVALSIVLVRFFSYNIQVLWDPSSSATRQKQQWLAIACCCVVILLVLLDGDTHFITSGDLIFFYANAGYILCYVVFHVSRIAWAGGKQEELIPVYNIIIGSLQLVACRFYSSAETPYNLVFIGVLATRAW